MDDPQTCTYCKNGPPKSKRKRRPSTVPKDGSFTCCVCGKSKPLDQVRTKYDPKTDSYIRNPDNICRPCNLEIVDSRKEHQGTRQETIERVTRKYRGTPPVVTVGTEREAVEHAVVDESKPGGQGFQIDQEMKDVIEKHAVDMARGHYSQLGETIVVGDRKIWDLECSADDVEKHIEVKGTSTEGAQIFLTQNQVEHYQAYPHVALFLVSKIKVARDKSGQVRVIDEGEPMIFDPWELRPENLQTIQYRYSLP